MTKTAHKQPSYDIQPRRALRQKDTGGRPRKPPTGWSPYGIGDVVIGRKVIKVLVHNNAKKKHRYRVKYITCGHVTDTSHAGIQTAIRDKKPGRTDQGYCPECLKLKTVKLLLLAEVEATAKASIPAIRNVRPPSDPGGHWLGWMDRWRHDEQQLEKKA